MIPTEFRDKLPKKHSYPIGAEIITEALANIPQYSELKLWFSRSPVLSASTFHHLLESRTPTVVIEATFSKIEISLSSSDDYIKRGFHDPQWRINIYPVLSRDKSVASRVICDSVLPAIRKWLVQQRPESWHFGGHRLVFTFDPTAGTITAEEK